MTECFNSTILTLKNTGSIKVMYIYIYNIHIHIYMYIIYIYGGHVSGEMCIKTVVPCFLVLDTQVCGYECREGEGAMRERKK